MVQTHESRLENHALLVAIRGYERAVEILRGVTLPHPEPLAALQERLNELRAEAMRRGLGVG